MHLLPFIIFTQHSIPSLFHARAVLNQGGPLIQMSGSPVAPNAVSNGCIMQCLCLSLVFT